MSVPPPGFKQPEFSPPVSPTPAAPVERAELGSRWLRFCAAIVDGIVVGVPLVVLSLLAGVEDSNVLSLIPSLVTALLYSPLLMAREGAHNGQTLGKQWLGLRVIRNDGRQMDYGKGLMREFVGRLLLTVVTCGIYGILDPLWCLWDRRKQCLHDKVADTLVVVA